MTIFYYLFTLIASASVNNYYEMTFTHPTNVNETKRIVINTEPSGYEIDFRFAGSKLMVYNVESVYFDPQVTPHLQKVGKPQPIKPFSPVVISAGETPIVLISRGWGTLDLMLLFPNGSDLFKATLELAQSSDIDWVNKINKMSFDELIKSISVSNVVTSHRSRMIFMSVESSFGSQSLILSTETSFMPGWEPETRFKYVGKYFLRYTNLNIQNEQLSISENNSDTKFDFPIENFWEEQKRANIALPEKTSLLNEYEIQNTSEGLFVVRLADGKKVKMSSEMLGRNPEPSVEDGILRISGLKRRLSLKDFDLESSFVPTGTATPFRTNDRTIDPWKEIYDSFPVYNLTDTNKFYFSPEDQSSIQKMVKTLKRMGPKSFVLLGNPGSGKTVLMKESLAKLPKSWQVLELRSDSLESGGQYVGSIADKIRTMVEVSKEAPIVFVVDELHTLTGAGTHSQDPNDVLQKLKSHMASGQIILAGTDTTEEFYEHITDSALLRRLNQIQMPEYSEESIKAKLTSWLTAYGFKTPDEKMLEKVMRISSEFFPNDSEPFRTTQIFDQILSNMSPEENDWSLTSRKIEEAIKEMTKRDPREWSIEGIRQKLAELPKKYRKKVAGQDEVLPKLLKMTRNTLFGLKSSEGPGVRLLMVGPHGVGKSLRAKAYAEAIGASFHLIDMTIYRDTRPSFLVSEIAEQLIKDPHTVFFFDELEKTSVDAQRVLLTILSSDYFHAKIMTKNGRLRNRKLTTRFMKVIAATNAGFHRHIEDRGSIGFVSDLSPESNTQHRNIIAALKEEIEPALIDRMAGEHNIAVIRAPQGRDLRQVLLLKISEHLDRFHHQNSMQARFSAKKLGEFVDKWVEGAMKNGLSPREVERDMLAELDDVISLKIENGNYEEKNGRVRIIHQFGNRIVRSCRPLLN